MLDAEDERPLDDDGKMGRVREESSAGGWEIGLQPRVESSRGCERSPHELPTIHDSPPFEGHLSRNDIVRSRHILGP